MHYLYTLYLVEDLPKKMGKKSRRPNRNKPKDIPAAASTAPVAGPRQGITSATDAVATFKQLFTSQDWAGLLELESKMSIAKTFESSNPSLAGIINFMLGSAHKGMSREGGIEQATLYYQKAIELAKKAGDNDILAKGVMCLSGFYVEVGRVEEAMDLYKSLYDKIGKERMDPKAILSFAEILEDTPEYSIALEILEHYLDTIERS